MFVEGGQHIKQLQLTKPNVLRGGIVVNFHFLKILN